MNLEVNKNTLKMAGLIVIGLFVVLGILTTVLAIFEDDDKATSEIVESLDKQDEGKAPYKFDADREDREEGIDPNDTKDEEKEPDPFEELDELIGLESVKEEVKALANYVKVQKQREAQGLKVPKLSYHLVFTGSPGTGKTTVARIVARIYKNLGILKRGHLVETDRSGLIGQYVGQTAPRVNAMCDSALNGVLFIDEAYALTQAGGQDYGQEAVATLLKRMEDNRDKLVVIVAGYTDEMKKFIDTNPGLQSRFTRYINFPDYSAEELYRIFRMYMRKNQYTITKEAANYLYQRLDDAVKNKDRNFGNARFARNVFEKAIQCQANRLSATSNASPEELTEITLADIKQAI
jgi:type VII secretion ATPase EccA